MKRGNYVDRWGPRLLSLAFNVLSLIGEEQQRSEAQGTYIIQYTLRGCMKSTLNLLWKVETRLNLEGTKHILSLEFSKMEFWNDF